MNAWPVSLPTQAEPVVVASGITLLHMISIAIADAISTPLPESLARDGTWPGTLSVPKEARQWINTPWV